jgi:hypothetical protein
MEKFSKRIIFYTYQPNKEDIIMVSPSHPMIRMLIRYRLGDSPPPRAGYRDIKVMQ